MDRVLEARGEEVLASPGIAQMVCVQIENPNLEQGCFLFEQSTGAVLSVIRINYCDSVSYLPLVRSVVSLSRCRCDCVSTEFG